MEGLKYTNRQMKVKEENVEGLLNNVAVEMKEGRSTQVELCSLRCLFFLCLFMFFVPLEARHLQLLLRPVS